MERCQRKVLLDMESIRKTRSKKCCFCVPWYFIRRFIRGSRSHAMLRRNQTPWHSRVNFEEQEDDPVSENYNVEMFEENGNSMVSVGRSPSLEISLSELKYDEEPEFSEKNPEQ